MTTCPHCNKTCNPIRFIWVSRWTPYKCHHCKGKSQFSGYSSGILGGLFGLLGYAVYTFLSSTFDNSLYLNLCITILPLTSIAILLQWLFFKLEAV